MAHIDIDAIKHLEADTLNRRFHLLMGRLFGIVAEYKADEAGMRAANAFMESELGQGCGVLDVEDGRIIIADCADRGMLAHYQWYRVTWADGIHRDVWAASEAHARRRADDLMEHEFIEHGAIMGVLALGA
jgi:hypothetical protein